MTSIRTFSIIYTLFITLVVVSATMGWFPGCFATVRTVANDKMLHFLLVGNLALLLNLSLPWTTIGPFPSGSLIMFCLATVEEFSQLFFDNRTFDLSDLSSNYLGIIVLGTFGWWLRRRLLQQQD